jgi:hypothetical protein
LLKYLVTEFLFEQQLASSDSNSRSPSFLGYLTSQGSLAATPPDAADPAKPSSAKKSKVPPPPLFLLPPSASSSALKNNSSQPHLNLNSSSSSHNLSARLHDFNFLRKFAHSIFGLLESSHYFQ